MILRSTTHVFVALAPAGLALNARAEGPQLVSVTGVT